MEVIKYIKDNQEIPWLKSYCCNELFEFFTIDTRNNLNLIKNKKIINFKEKFIDNLIKELQTQILLKLNYEIEMEDLFTYLKSICRLKKIEVESDNCTKTSRILENLRYLENLSTLNIKGIYKDNTHFYNLLDISMLNNLKVNLSHILPNNLEKSLFIFERLQLNYLSFTFTKENIQHLKLKFLSFLKNLRNLYSIDLSIYNCNLDNDSIKNLASYFLYLENLKALKLNLSLNSFYYSGTRFLTTAFTNLINLTRLEVKFSNNSIGDDGPFLISSSFKSLQGLNYLNLGLEDVGISDYGLLSILKELKVLNNLKDCILNFKSNKIALENQEMSFNYPDFSTFELNLGDNKISSDSMKSLVKTFSNMKKLTRFQFDISYQARMFNKSPLLIDFLPFRFLYKLEINHKNSFQGFDTLTLFSKSLSKINTLQILILDLETNNIDNEGIISLSEHISILSRLIILKLLLANNRISKIGGCSISSSLKCLPVLEEFELDLTNNMIDNKIALGLYQSFKGITKFSLDYLTNDRFNSFDKTIFILNKLIYSLIIVIPSIIQIYLFYCK